MEGLGFAVAQLVDQEDAQTVLVDRDEGAAAIVGGGDLAGQRLTGSMRILDQHRHAVLALLLRSDGFQLEDVAALLRQPFDAVEDLAVLAGDALAAARLVFQQQTQPYLAALEAGRVDGDAARSARP